MSGAVALANASNHDVLGAALGLAVAAGGAAEIHGVGLLSHGEKKGGRWLVASQLYLLVLLVGYSIWGLTHTDLNAYKAVITDDVKSQIAELGYSVDDFLLLIDRVKYGTLAVGTLLYQGGMALYYHRRRPALERGIDEALAEE